MRLVFMGTPDFAVPSLRALAAAGHEIVAVYTQPDRPSGRGRTVQPSPVKVEAIKLHFDVLQPASLRPAEEVERLAALKPDCIVVAAFGQLLRPNVIAIPPRGIVNVHASLLPRWRGAAPVTAAILAGDARTGVTIMQIDPGMDTGPMLSRAEVPITPDDTTGTLTEKLAELGATLLAETLPRWEAGEITPEAQDNALATMAPRLKSDDAAIDWSRPAAEIARQVRAYQPWPGAQTTFEGKRLTILAAACDDAKAEGAPGTFVPLGKRGVGVLTGDGLLRLERVQREGGKPMSIDAFRAGHGNFEQGQ